MEHSLEKDFNPYRNYTRSNLILGLPIFIIQLLLIFFLFPIQGINISSLLTDVFFFLKFAFPFSLLILGLLLLLYCIPSYFVGYTAKKMNLKYNSKDRMKAAGLTAFYYWIFSSFLLQIMGLVNWKNVPFSAFGLFSLYVAAAGMISSTTMAKNTMLPMIGMKKQKKNPATEITDLYRPSLPSSWTA